MQQIKVSKKFINDFECVVQFYSLSQTEIDYLKDKTRQHYAGMSKSIGIIAENIRIGYCE